jgi:hypothetical protein
MWALPLWLSSDEARWACGRLHQRGFVSAGATSSLMPGVEIEVGSGDREIM